VLPPPLVDLIRTGTALQLTWVTTLAERTQRFLDKVPKGTGSARQPPRRRRV
jgi:hypothetical protein